MLFVASLALLTGQAGSELAGDVSTPPLTDILDRMSRSEESRAQALRFYTSTRTYHLHNQRFRKTAEMTVRFNYRHPGRKDFVVMSQSGSAIVNQRVLRRMMETEVEASQEALRRLHRITADNYDFRFLRRDSTDGRPVYVLDAAPKGKSKYLLRGEVWVDTADFAVAKVVGRPGANPSIWVRDSRFVYRFGKFGPFWLPLSTDSEADALIFGHTEVKIQYGGYEISPSPGDGTDGK